MSQDPINQTIVLIRDPQLTIQRCQDGVWLHFKARGGHHSSINMRNLALAKDGLIGSALFAWCEQFTQEGILKK